MFFEETFSTLFLYYRRCCWFYKNCLSFQKDRFVRKRFLFSEKTIASKPQSIFAEPRHFIIVLIIINISLLLRFFSNHFPLLFSYSASRIEDDEKNKK